MDVGANRLRELRKKTGKSQEVVGGLVGVSQSRMSDFETGVSPVPSDILIMLAKMYNVTTDYLLYLSDDKYSIQTKTITDDEYSYLTKIRRLSTRDKKIVDAVLTAALK